MTTETMTNSLDKFALMPSVRDKMLASRSRRYEQAHCEGLGWVRVQSLSELERAKVERAAGQDVTRLRATLIAMSVVDVEGHRLFSDDEVDAILDMDSRITLALSDIVMEHIGRDKTEAHLKNSSATPGEPVP